MRKCRRCWFTYYGQVGSSAPTCRRCEHPNPKYDPDRDPKIDQQLREAVLVNIENYCDGCGECMVTINGVTGYMVTRGRDLETGLPLVKMYCRTCHNTGKIPPKEGS